MSTEKMKKLEKSLEDLRDKPDKGVYGKRKVDVINKIAFELCFSAPRKAQTLASQAFAMAEKLTYTKGMFDSYNKLGISYLYRSDYDKALEYFFGALEWSNIISDKKRVGGVYHNIGLACYRKGDYAAALEYYFKAVKLRKKHGHKTELAKDYDNIGSVHREQGDATMALDYHFRALRVFKKIAARRDIAISHQNIGLAYNVKGEYAKALNYFLKSARYFEKTGNKLHLTISLINLAIAYMHQHDYEKAMELSFKCLQFARETGDKLSIAYAYSLIGWANKSLGKVDQSVKYYKKAYFLSEKTGNKSHLTEILIHIAESLIEKGEFDEALTYCFKAMYLSLEIGNKPSLMQTYLVLGILCKESGCYHAALCYLQNSLKTAKDMGRKEDEMECYLSLTESYEAQHDFQNAFIHHKKYSELKEGIFSTEKDKYINELKTRYEADRKEKEAEIYRLKNVELRREIRQRKKAGKELREHRDRLENIVAERTANLKTTNIELMKEIAQRKRAGNELIAYQKQLRSLAHELSLVEEKQRRRIATNLHDNISQSLMIVKSNLETLAATISSKQVQEKLKEIQSHVREMIQRTRSMTFEISPPVLYELGLEPAVEWLAERFQEQHGVTCEFRDDGKVKPISEDWRSILFQSTRELLANVRKHADASKVAVSMSNDGKHIRITVKDDGAGFNPEILDEKIAKNEGFGLFNLRQRLTHLRGKVEIDSKIGKGTTVTLLAPLKQGKKATARIRT
jgi:signal transduction histidine kinase